MRAAEAALNHYRQSQDSVDLTFETENLLTQISSVEAELTTLEGEEEELLERYTVDHPAYRKLVAEKERLNERFKALQGQVEALPDTQQGVLNLSRDLKLKQEIYTKLLERAQEVRVLKASTVGNVRVLDRAQASTVPIAPSKGRIIMLSIILGGMLGSGIVLIRNWLRRGIEGGEELEALGMPVFASITYASAMDEITARGDSLPILAVDEPNSLTVEALKSLRTSLHFGMLDAQSRSLAITSAAPSAGKTFTSVNLATLMAQAGQKVCLVDADLRRGKLHKYFGNEKTQPGLAEYLAGAVQLRDIISETEIKGLFFLSTGRRPPNPSELLMQKRFSDLVTQLDGEFDFTLIDSPPALAVTDPVIIARQVGATVAIIRYDETTVPEVAALQDTFDKAGVKLAGGVLNALDPREARKRYGYNYNYRYEYRG
ncbi:capsular exopolysaccharide synthesis family protein [Rhodovulum adriaticum]|uniref:Capsular exopolysaccharide synthesis family protein n=2 Tax=Rhodovulum adriaticum TaxID=35804 RepID=A0A4R2NGJ2_RHOAD|nr:capsular exopolysaccharide synthesis family protein [Rhodovulum adriaticum]